MELAHASLDQLDENECLDNGVACSPDCEALVVSFVQDSEGIAKVVFDSALGRHSDLVFGGRVLIANLAAFAGLLWFLFVGRIRRVLLAGIGCTASVLGSLCILWVGRSLLCVVARFFICVRG